MGMTFQPVKNLCHLCYLAFSHWKFLFKNSSKILKANFRIKNLQVIKAVKLFSESRWRKKTESG